jgi:ribonuclease HI
MVLGTRLATDSAVRLIYYRHGVWNSLISNEHSSNYRELRNLIESLEKAAEAGLLTNTEVWLFTDNTTAEAAYFRGSSKSRQLHGLVLRASAFGNKARHHHPGYSCVWKKNYSGQRGWCVPW